MEPATFNERAALVKETITALQGVPAATAQLAKGQLTAAQIKTNMVLDLKLAAQEIDALRTSTQTRGGIDISWGQYVKEKWGLAPSDRTGSPDALYLALGIDPSRHTMSQFATMPEFNENYRWLIPEIIREAVRLGLRTAPIYSKLIATEEFVSQPTVIMPQINMSDATPQDLNEIETIQTGMVSFGQKQIALKKIGTGLKVSDEVNEYVPINVLSIYLQDVGVKLGLKLDAMAVLALLNGDQADGSMSAATIGVENTTTGFQYLDLLRAWLRLGRIGRTPDRILSNEGPALSMLQMAEFKGFAGQTTVATSVMLESPIPQVQRLTISGTMPSTNKMMMIDTSRALIKFNSSALKIEGERIVERGLNATYLHTTTGFANMFRDARLIVDKSIAFSGNGFPSWMDVDAFQNVSA